MAPKLNAYRIDFTIHFRGKAKDSIAEGECHSQVIKAATMEEAERHAKPLLMQRLKSDGMPGAFSLRWHGSTTIKRSV